MGRPGFRTSRKKHKRGKIAVKHRIGKDETIEWFKRRFDGIVLG